MPSPSRPAIRPRRWQCASDYETPDKDAASIHVENKVPVFTIEELEIGLRMLGRADLDRNAFWDANIASFRQTVLIAIRETSTALLSPNITSAWRSELEHQLEALVQYIELAQRYSERRSICGSSQHIN